jgi:hypothetical protein
MAVLAAKLVTVLHTTTSNFRPAGTGTEAGTAEACTGTNTSTRALAGPGTSNGTCGGTRTPAVEYVLSFFMLLSLLAWNNIMYEVRKILTNMKSMRRLFLQTKKIKEAHDEFWLYSFL